MIKVFLVEDECLVREGLRDNIPWSENGFEFVGEAADGEMALPLIRKLKPDVLITDIKMPFMDGLDLSRLVSAELPDTKIIIISGYDDFEYAQQAIDLHVARYLLKPITKTVLLETLKSVKEAIDRDQEQKDYLQRFMLESREYEQFERRNFFEQLAAGKLSVNEIYRKAKELDISISAENYNVVLFMIWAKNNTAEYSESVSRLQDELVAYYLKRGDCLLFRWNLISFAVIVKGNAGNESDITARTDSAVQQIRTLCEAADVPVDWYVATGSPVERVSSIGTCFANANHILSGRFLAPEKHVLSVSDIEGSAKRDESLKDIETLDVGVVDPMVLRNFLSTGITDEIDDFLEGYFKNLGSSLESLMFRQYLILSVRFNAAIMAVKFGFGQDEFMAKLPEMDRDMSSEGAKRYIRTVLETAIAVREDESRSLYGKLLKKAVDYIDSNFDNENISLNSVAKEVNVSANYFSAIFSQEMGQTFIEYVTAKRMDKAKELLRITSKRSGEIAFEVGYRDPRYFSFIFKKTLGCTPRDYRAGRKQ